MNELRISDKIKWSSAAGNKEGVIINIYIAKNGNGELIPFLVVQMESPYGGTVNIQIVATDSYLKMMKIERIA